MATRSLRGKPPSSMISCLSFVWQKLSNALIHGNSALDANPWQILPKSLSPPRLSSPCAKNAATIGARSRIRSLLHLLKYPVVSCKCPHKNACLAAPSNSFRAAYRSHTSPQSSSQSSPQLCNASFRSATIADPATAYRCSTRRAETSAAAARA